MNSKNNPRKIKYIVIHCTASNPEAKVADIQAYWKKQLGWENPGYHYLIKRNGDIVQLQKENLIANGVAGYNKESIHLSYIGGIDKQGKPTDNRTDAQQSSMFDKIVSLTENYPEAKVLGHRDFPNQKKACPCFDVRDWLRKYEPDLESGSDDDSEDESSDDYRLAA
jgi:N-acetylmuramoyl-L-alanine amidase